MNKLENGQIEEISVDVDDIVEDTASIDKKTSWLIALWIVDKIIMAILIITFGR